MGNEMKIEDFEKIPNDFFSEVEIKDFFNETEIKNEFKGAEHKTVFDEPQNPIENEIETKARFETNNNGSETPLNLANFLTPELTISLIDNILPLAVTIVTGFIGYRIKRNDLKLTAGEKNTIEPIVEQCLQQMNLVINNPFVALGLSLSIIYGTKTIDIIQNGNFEKKSVNPIKKQPTLRKDGRGRPKKGFEKNKPQAEIKND
jgi:hypothetical protein